MNGKRVFHDYHIETDSPHLSRRQKTWHYGSSDGVYEPENSSSISEHGRYTIAWICALHIEMAAAQAMLDEIHDAVGTYPDDNNTYTLGSIKGHNIVIACLPNGQYGTINAANVLTNLTRTFKSIRLGLMVGIGGGVPGMADIRFGDVVVGTRVMQYDLGKIVKDGEIRRTAIPKIPHSLVGTAISALRAKHELNPSRIPSILREKLGMYPHYSRPNLPDRLFAATSEHIHSTASCDRCEGSKLVPRATRPSFDPAIHYGVIASGNQLMTSGTMRDNIARQLDAICFEMEAAGLMDIWPCLPIRGICDYSDSHKNKEWQNYAAATAAAYARELLELLPTAEVPKRFSYTVSNDQPSPHDRRKELLDSLRYEQIDSRKIDIKSAHAKTCSWFLKHTDYQAWLDPMQLAEHCGFLWIRGKPGAGKSTIMKFIYNKTNKKAGNAVVASFFFHARGGALEKSISGMYRSLLLQLLEGYPDLQVVLDDTDLIPRNQKEWTSLNVLQDVFCSAVSGLGQRPFTCFVDALDECDEQEVRTMVQDIEDLAKRSTEMGTPLRICFSSRHYPYIDIDRGIKLTLENQSGHTQDLETYVGNRLKVRDSALVEQVLRKAAGVFLWVVLVVDILNTEHSRGGLAMKKRLAELPSNLSALFKDMLERDRENMEELLLCVVWILYAKQPLKPDEYYHALWSGLSLKGLVDDEIPIMASSDANDITHRCVTSSSKGLAEITRSKHPTVQFIHESVRDFLIKDKGLQELWPDHGFDLESPSHERLKQCCIKYMNHNSVCETINKLIASNKTNEEMEISIAYPFLGYASQNILFHADNAARAIPQHSFLSTFVVPEWIDIINFFEKFKARRYNRDTGLLYILAEKNLANLIRIHPDRASCFKIENDRYGPPIFAALACGSNEAVLSFLEARTQAQPEPLLHDLYREYTESEQKRISFGRSFEFSKKKGSLRQLMERGDDLISVFLIYWSDDVYLNSVDRKGQTPLSYTTSVRNERVFQALLERNVNMETKDHNGWSPLSLAASSGSELFVQQLLATKGVDSDSRNNDGNTPLSQAAFRGHDGVVKQLLAIEGIDPDSRNNDGNTPLSQAAFRGHDGVVKQLLAIEGVDPDSRNNDGNTPLSRAAYEGRDGVVKQLLAIEGVDPDSRNNDGNTPLLLAAFRGYDGVVKQLLATEGVDPDSRNNDGNTPLLLAAFRGYDGVVKQLLATEAVDPDSRNNNGDTPLSRAAYQGSDGVVKQLLAIEGVDPDSRNNDGDTPLSQAAYWGHDGVVKQLLATEGVDPDSRNNDGNTPLSQAAYWGHGGVVKQLLAIEGVDPDSRNNDGNTPLSRAAYEGRDGVVKQLLAIEGVDPDSRNNDGNTPLSRAAYEGRDGVVKQLLATEGVDPDSRNNHGNTPLLNAVQEIDWIGSSKSYALVKLLLATGRVDLDSRNRDGSTPLSIAESLRTKTRYSEIFQLLQKYKNKDFGTESSAAE